MDTSEVGLVASQIVTSLGADWDQSGFELLVGNANGFQFGTFLTLLEKRYLTDVDRAGLVEALNAVTNTFIEDIIKKVRQLKSLGRSNITDTKRRLCNKLSALKCRILNRNR